MTPAISGRRRVWRWIQRIVLGLLAVLVVAIGALVIAIHTDYGRALIRSRAEAALQEVFVGGASLGKVEGSPFGELVIRDLVINGPDHAPAITVRTLRFELGLWPLLSQRVELATVIAEDVEVLLDREANGELELMHLTKPGPTPTWSLDIAWLALHRGHVRLETGPEVVNLDQIEIFGAAHVAGGEPVSAHASVRALWRERAAGVGVDAVIRTFEGATSIPSVIAMVGGVTVAGAGVRIAAVPGRAPVIDGTLIVDAPAAAAAQLVPDVALPDDVAVAVTASSAQPWTNLSVIGRVGETPVRAMLRADLDRERAMGTVASGDVDVTKLTHGKVTGRGGGLVVFDAQHTSGELPTASGILTAWGDLAEVPDAHVAAAFTSAGGAASTIVGFAGTGTCATFTAAVHKAGEVITLERASLVARTRDPARATGGNAPVHGALQVELSATGVLTPSPDLALVGKVDGQHLQMRDLSVSSLKLEIDAKQLPRRPLGRAELLVGGLVRGDLRLGDATVRAASREGGKIAVSVHARPELTPWLFDVDALVTPPGAGEVTVVDILHHRVRAGAGQRWSGSSGHLEIGRSRIALRDLQSASSGGKLAVSGSLDRAGRNQGDLVAKIDATGISLQNLGLAYRGNVDAHVDVERKANRWAGDVRINAAGISTDPSTVTFDANAEVSVHDRTLLVDARASSRALGAAKVSLDLEVPTHIDDVAAWRRLGRSAVVTARLTLDHVDLAAVAKAVGERGVISGRLDGDIQISERTTGGTLRLRDVRTPALRGTGGVTADLQISQSAPDELTSRLHIEIDGIAGIQGDARIGVPARLFDPAAWRALGRGALRGATVRVANVDLDPGKLARFHVTTQLRGRMSLVAEIAGAAKTAQLAIDIHQLRGTSLAQPIDLHVAVALDAAAATPTLIIRAGTLTLVEMHGRIPVSIDRLLANPRAIRALPLDLTASIPSASAPALLGVFGRTAAIGGTIKGDVKISGTLGAPLVRASLVGLALQVPPGRGSKRIKTIDKISVGVTWDGTLAKLSVDGVQQAGSLHIAAEGVPNALARATVVLQAKQFDLTPVLAFAPGAAGGAAGRLDANLTITGLDPTTARIRGELHLGEAWVPIAPEIGTLRRAKIDLVAGERDMKIGVIGKLGAGDVNVVGTVALDGASVAGGDATITLRKVSPIGSVEPVIDADITAKLHREADRLVADLVVRTAHVKVSSDRGEPLKPVGAPADMVFSNGARVGKLSTKHAPPRRAAIVVNVKIDTTHIESEELDTVIKGELTLTADAQSVGVIGTIEADRGDLDLFGRRYQVDRAQINFDGTTDPLLDLQITHDFPEVTLITTVRGRLSKPELKMSSDPGTYSQDQLLGFLLGGEPSGDPMEVTARDPARDQAAGIGTSFVANVLGGYVKKALPVDIDVLRYEAASASSSAAVIVGSWLTSSLFLAFRRRLGARPDENAGEGQVEYWLSRRVSVQAIAGDRGYGGIDLLWRKRY